ncbi:MAG: alpha/beta hydrolase [Anaerolineaceae bacterium]|nr:alpha/beta hydrolase [Anaerolineaceae bacterium]
MAAKRKLQAARNGGLGLGALTSLAAVAAGGWILYSKFAVDHHQLLPDAIAAERKEFLSKTAGQLSYYVDQRAGGRPLVVLHSINAAASAYEMGPLFEHYRSKRAVYALDWPGYGFSERSSRVYSAQVFVDALVDFLTSQVGEPADVVALSLGAEFATLAALAHPELFHSLTLISPTGMNPTVRANGSQIAKQTGASDVLHPILSAGLWGRPLFDLVASHSSINFFLRKSFSGAVPPGFVEYAYASAHQPGAEHAPLYFLSGKLFTPQVRSLVYEKIKTPTLAIYDRDAYTTFGALEELLLHNPAWQAVRLVPSQGMPHYERTADTAEVMDAFWKGIK